MNYLQSFYLHIYYNYKILIFSLWLVYKLSLQITFKMKIDSILAQSTRTVKLEKVVFNDMVSFIPEISGSTFL